MIIYEKPLNDNCEKHKIIIDTINENISKSDQTMIQRGYTKIIDKIIDHEIEENQHLTEENPFESPTKIYYKIRYKTYYGENDEWFERAKFYQKIKNANEYETIYINNLQYIDEDKKEYNKMKELLKIDTLPIRSKNYRTLYDYNKQHRKKQKRKKEIEDYKKQLAKEPVKRKITRESESQKRARIEEKPVMLPYFYSNY